MSQTPLTAVPWVAVTLTDIQNARPGPLVTAFQTTALASGQSDPTTAIIQKCTAELLSAVGMSGRVVMDASQGQVVPDVVPPNLFDMLVEAICRRMQKRLRLPWTDDEKADQRHYEEILLKLRTGDYPVDMTNNPGNAASISSKGGSVATVGGNPRLFRQAGCNGNFWGGNPL